MKKFKNVFLLAAMAVSAVCVTSCGDDDEPAGGGSSFAGVIHAVFSDKNTSLGEVKVVVNDYTDQENNSAQNNIKSYELAHGEYANGGFTLTLPNPVPDECLLPYGYVYAYNRDSRKYELQPRYNDLYMGIASDDEAKYLFLTEASFVPYNKNGVNIGGYVGGYEFDAPVGFLYVDRDVDIIELPVPGGGKPGETNTWHLKKGWTLLVEYGLGGGSYTTTISPSTDIERWYFSEIR
ncbi:hypothetical protein AGMMS4957_12840 [Bacteroidia bacterium]|nr:hypothetical protein AGMMS4957_12840 [Bacteroidia bacterium]